MRSGAEGAGSVLKGAEASLFEEQDILRRYRLQSDHEVFILQVVKAASGCEQVFAVLDGVCCDFCRSRAWNCKAGRDLSDFRVDGFLAGELRLEGGYRSTLGGW